MRNQNPILVAVGTRPEIIKMAPIIRALQANSIPFTFLHCGQHYDYDMSQQFIEQLNLPLPDFGYKIHINSPAQQTAQIIAKAAQTIKKTKPALVLTEGDTNSTLATALAANKQKTNIGHVEAGLRSFDLRMPEEHNRRIVDHISTFLFAPTQHSAQNLQEEKVWGKIYITGNTIIDAVKQHLQIAEDKSTIMKTVEFKEFALVTAHRQENVDNPKVLKNLVEAFTEASLPVVYPIHPRTVKRLRKTRLWKKLSTSENVQVLPPAGYFDFLVLMKNSRLIITDSGGIQEEATVPQIRKSVLVIRLSTERPEAVEAGFAKVVGTEKNTIINEINNTLDTNPRLPENSPYGDGDAAQKIVKIIQQTVDSSTFHFFDETTIALKESHLMKML
jgi:UDP-N-acetylglucosamine 2-epimerase (non-hydrolysing)